MKSSWEHYSTLQHAITLQNRLKKKTQHVWLPEELEIFEGYYYDEKDPMQKVSDKELIEACAENLNLPFHVVKVESIYCNHKIFDPSGAE